ncbi:MAG TPA: sulfotransferase [Sphingomicrobium sp.]|nr:sulfotransferase [Sphingomicrobium sp.]
MSKVSPAGQRAIEQARQGDFDGALATATEAIARKPDDAGLRFFAGMLHVRRSELPEAADQLRKAVELEPRDPLARAELARILVALGELDEAKLLLDGLQPRDRTRLSATIAARRGDHERAIPLLREAVELDPRDFESWGNLGVSLLITGNAPGAEAALANALRLRPGHSSFGEKWAEAVSQAGLADRELPKLYAAAARDPGGLITAARIEDLEGQPDRAVAALEQALERQPGQEAALVALADLEERANRIDALQETIAELEQAAPSSPKLPLLRARAAYRLGDMKRALELAEAAPADVDSATRAQILGQANDRLGDSKAAFRAFEEMNRIDSFAAHDPAAKAADYLATFRERRTDVLTRDWVDRWPEWPPPEREPAFLIGFPRSGTTLLDTLLMNDPGIAVSEENPMLTHVSARIGAFDRIAGLGAGDVAELRSAYFEEAESYLPDSKGKLLLDKFPFALGAAPLIHRLFPGARIIFLSRHPCDVVLSCFMNRFQPTDIGSTFLTLEGTARLYDAMMQLWTRSRELLPLTVLDVRYEALVEEPKPQMQRVAEFLGIAWSETLVDNRPAAEKRGFIKTPSYSQVSEPIYKRAVERWRNYSEELGPVLPILKPWIEALGYEA